MTTIQDVARRAGVAPITASRVINQTGYTSQAVREQVLAAAEELGYVPNTLARGLRLQRTNTIALIFTDITNPFFTEMARGVEDAASDAGYLVIFCNTDESESEEQKYLQALLEKRVDGILLVPAHQSIAPLQKVRDQKMPVVIIDRWLSDDDPAGKKPASGRMTRSWSAPIPFDTVRCDSESASCQLTRLLLLLGHRHIAMLTGPHGISTADDRVTGYRRALTELNLPIDERLIYYGSFNQTSGAKGVDQVLSSECPPTAIFAANNFIAIGVLNRLRELGKRVPEDIALVEFDDLPPNLVTFPFITGAAQPAYEMGQIATHMLLERLQNPSIEPREIILPTRIVIRQSSGDPLKIDPQAW